MTVRIEYDAAVALLKEIVAEKGEDFVYERIYDASKDDSVCRYVEAGAPSCLVGNFLARLGVSLEEMVGLEGKAASFVMEHLTPDVGPKTITLLNEAQYHQDAGKPWGYALDRAVDYANAAEYPHGH